MLFAHLKRILTLDPLRLRGPNGARDEFHLAATAHNLRKLAKLIPALAPIAAASMNLVLYDRDTQNGLWVVFGVQRKLMI
jgi:hypothetical protein